MSEPDLSTDGSINTMSAMAAPLPTGIFNAYLPGKAVPNEWKERAEKAWQYYLEEPLVKNCINSWRIFAVGDAVTLGSEDETLRREAETFAKRIKLTRFVKDMVLQLLVTGDAVGYKMFTSDMKDLSELVNVNPTSVTVKYVDGELAEINQHVPSGEMTLNVDQTLHLKWDAPSFSPRGNSMVLPAFHTLELLRDYRDAERAIAKRWTTPLRLIKVGSKESPPNQKMLDDIRRGLSHMDLKSGMVVPFWVSADTEPGGQVLNTERKTRELKEDIMVAMGMSRSLVTGDGPNFATASVSLQKMFVMIREIKQMAHIVLDWVFDSWKDLHGHHGQQIQFYFNDLDPTDAVDFKKLLLELYDRKLISRSTLQMKMELNPEIERANRASETQTVDLFDERQVRPIIELVNAGLLEVDLARVMLGTKSKTPAAQASLEETPENLCDDCTHFATDTNQCSVFGEERAFDTPACRFFEGDQ